MYIVNMKNCFSKCFFDEGLAGAEWYDEHVQGLTIHQSGLINGISVDLWFYKTDKFSFTHESHLDLWSPTSPPHQSPDAEGATGCLRNSFKTRIKARPRSSLARLSPSPCRTATRRFCLILETAR